MSLNEQIKAINDNIHVDIKVTGINGEDTLEIRMILERLANLIEEFKRNGINVSYKDDDSFKVI
jgi:hypothetical protein